MQPLPHWPDPGVMCTSVTPAERHPSSSRSVELFRYAGIEGRENMNRVNVQKYRELDSSEHQSGLSFTSELLFSLRPQIHVSATQISLKVGFILSSCCFVAVCYVLSTKASHYVILRSVCLHFSQQIIKPADLSWLRRLSSMFVLMWQCLPMAVLIQCHAFE